MRLGRVPLANLLACTLHEAGTQTAIEGHLYAAVMGACDLDTFNEAIGLLVQSGLVEKIGHHELRVTAALKNAYDAAKKPKPLNPERTADVLH